jgi:MFS family permease
VGLLPGVAIIGVAGSLILLGLRLLQGPALGGEWAGSPLLVAEHAPRERRGQYGMFTPLGAGVGLVHANLAMLAVNFTVGETSPAFMTWGWRVPFLFSAVARPGWQLHYPPVHALTGDIHIAGPVQGHPASRDTSCSRLVAR